MVVVRSWFDIVVEFEMVDIAIIDHVPTDDPNCRILCDVVVAVVVVVVAAMLATMGILRSLYSFAGWACPIQTTTTCWML